MSQNPSPTNNPVIISIAPNGARKTREDHPHIPITPEELAYETRHCIEHGATMLHLHVRDDKYKHSISPELYRNAITAVKKEVGDKAVIQVTSEACGIFTPEEQMDMVKSLKPEAVSIAIRELVPSPDYEQKFAKFLEFTRQENIHPQYILYSDEDLLKFNDLVARGVIPGDHFCVLFVLGRYSAGQLSSPDDLLPFINTLNSLPIKERVFWFVCAFGPQENQCMLTAALLNGNVRIGFENNMYLADGSQAKSNAALVEQFSSSLNSCHKPIASIDQARKVLLAK